MKGISVILAITAVVGVANAQQMISKDGRPEKMNYIYHSNGVSITDHHFLQTAYLANAFEIKMGEIAVRRGQSEWSREFGKEMIQEHTGAQNELKPLAHDKNLWLNNDLPKAMVAQLRTLETISPSKFDATFRKYQLAAHAATSMAFQVEIKKGHDEMVRSYAIKILPAVKEHWAMAKMQKTMMSM